MRFLDYKCEICRFHSKMKTSTVYKNFQLTASYRHFHSYFIHSHKYKSTAAIRNFNYLTHRKFRIKTFPVVWIQRKWWLRTTATRRQWQRKWCPAASSSSSSRSLASRTRKCTTKSALDVLPSFVTKKTNDKPLLLLLLLAAATPP